MSTQNLVRYPDTRSPRIMATRAWWLVGLNLLIPGSAQLLAGSRRLGRFGVGTTFLLWGSVLLTLVVFLLDRELVNGQVVVAGHRADVGRIEAVHHQHSRLDVGHRRARRGQQATQPGRLRRADPDGGRRPTRQ